MNNSTITLTNIKYKLKQKESILNEAWANKYFIDKLKEYPIYDIQEFDTKEVSIQETWNNKYCEGSFVHRSTCGMIVVSFPDGSIIS